MAKLRDYIAENAGQLDKTLSELQREKAEIERKIRSIEKELADLRNAGKAIGIVTGLHLPLGITRRTPPKLTIKEAAMDVLNDYPDGLLALDLLAKINERHALNLPRTSLSPQLTRLKRAGKIYNHGSTWLPRQKPTNQ